MKIYANARASSFYECHARFFKVSLQRPQRHRTGYSGFILKMRYGNRADHRPVSKVFLMPPEETSSAPALGCGDHR
jgi:hypothetical protein